MIFQQDYIEQIKTSLESEVGVAVKQASEAFLSSLGDEHCPEDSNVMAGNIAAHSVIKDHVLSERWLSAVTGNMKIDHCEFSRIELAFDNIMPSLAIPKPQDASTMSSLRLALAASVGAILGMMVFTPLARLLLGMRDTGLFLGAPVGAMLLVLASCHAAENKWVKNVLVAALGVATITEVWALLSGGGVFSRLWHRLGGRRSGVKRLLVYGCAILVLAFSKRVPHIDRLGYEQTIVYTLRQWIDEAIIVLAFLFQPNTLSADSTQCEDMLYAIVAKIKMLQSAGKENVEFAVQELIQETENMGFSSGDGPHQFTWEDSKQNEYDTYGHIELGDLVIVERESVCFKDSIKHKGLVRKLRDRR